MTPEQHNRYLSWSHFIHAAFSGGLMVIVMGFMTVAMSLDPQPPPAPFIAIMLAFFAMMTAVMIVPSIVAGYALRKRKRWTKTMCIIAGVIASMSAPIGTAVCIYTFWFLFSEPGKSLYDRPQRLLPLERDTPWSAHQSTAKQEQYVPPSSPPDWR